MRLNLIIFDLMSKFLDENESFIYPFLVAMPMENYVDLVMKVIANKLFKRESLLLFLFQEIQTLCLGSLYFSPTLPALSKEFGKKIELRYIQYIKRNQYNLVNFE